MNYKNKTKEELLADVYRLEIANNKAKEHVNKLEQLLDKIQVILEDFKGKNWINKAINVAKLILTIVELIKEYRNEYK